VAGITYREVMTLLILFAAIAAAIATVVGYVNWRDQRAWGSFVDPSISRTALVQADRQGVQGLIVAATDLPAPDTLGHRSGSHARANRS
jgi:Flp pilus assembly protein CpaB